MMSRLSLLSQPSCVCILALLSASCGGGGGGGGSSGGGGNTQIPPASGTVYVNISDQAQSTTSRLSGVSLSSGSDDTLSILSVDGDLTHDTGALTLRDGSYTFSDMDGRDSGGIYSDGKGAQAGAKDYLDTSSYAYLTFLEQTYAINGVPYDSTILIGIATDERDIPQSGKATFQGRARADLITGSGGYSLKGGSVSMIADFSSGKVSLISRGFSSVDVVTGQASDAPIDTVKITDMTIDGDRFSGGDFVFEKNGKSVQDFLGSDAHHDVKGAFFGYNKSSGAPDEAGGVWLSEGSGGTMSGSFIAD